MNNSDEEVCCYRVSSGDHRLVIFRYAEKGHRAFPWLIGGESRRPKLYTGKVISG